MARRSDKGHFLAEQPRDSRFLLTIVRDVATAAVADAPTRDPRSVTHVEFKRAALLPELAEQYGKITTPNAICAQFPDRQGRPIRWHALLTRAFDEERSELSIRREHEARLNARADRGLSEEHVYFALTYVVRAEKEWSGRTARILRAASYDEARARLIAGDRRRKTPYDLAAMLPTRNQIERVAGGWWRACEIAGLELPTAATPAGRMGIPLVEAVLRYYVESGGFLPSYGQTLDFASDFRFSLQRFVGLWHEDVLAGARAEIKRRHLPDPGTYEPRSNPEVKPPEGYEPDPDDPVYQEKQYWSNKPLVLQFVIEFLDWLRHNPSSEPRWNRFRAEKAIWGIPLPNAQTLKARYGGLKLLVREASLPGALERAIVEYERDPTPEELAERERRQIERDAAKPQAQELLAFIRAQGEIGPKLIAETLGWSRTKVVIRCCALRSAGLISATHENPNHKKVRYFVIEGQTEQELRAIRAQREIELRAERQAAPVLLALLRERGYLPPVTISEEIGWGRDKLNDVLGDLLAARLVAATHGGTTRSVHYFAIDPETPDEEIEQRRAEIEERVEVETPQAQELLALLRKSDALMPKEIRELLDWAPEKVEYWLKPLLRHRLIARTHTSPKSRYGRYFAIEPDVNEEQLDELRAYWHSQLPQGADDGHRLHAFLLDHPEGMRPNTIKDEFGWGGTKVTEQLKQLERAGLAAHSGGGNQSSRWEGRRSSPPPGGWQLHSAKR